jgi:hypothetical protein
VACGGDRVGAHLQHCERGLAVGGVVGVGDPDLLGCRPVGRSGETVDVAVGVDGEGDDPGFDVVVVARDERAVAGGGDVADPVRVLAGRVERGRDGALQRREGQLGLPDDVAVGLDARDASSFIGKTTGENSFSATSFRWRAEPENDFLTAP